MLSSTVPSYLASSCVLSSTVPSDLASSCVLSSTVPAYLASACVLSSTVPSYLVSSCVLSSTVLGVSDQQARTRIFLCLPSCMEQSPQCSQNLGPIAVSFQEKPENVSFSKLILCNSYIICWLIRILFRYQYFDSCCGRLRDEHSLGVAFFKCLFTITITRIQSLGDVILDDWQFGELWYTKEEDLYLW